MHRFIFWGTILAGLAVAFGAFGTHLIAPALAQLETPNVKQTPPIQVFQTGVQYQFFHALAIIITGLLYRQKNNRHVKNAGLLFIIGIILFSGSLYFITIGYLMHRNFTFAGAITPLGGISFLIGWTLLAFNFQKHTGR
jgi:uncharacterized membrane protein YgdD (TMEM256/DUF423 family)